MTKKMDLGPRPWVYPAHLEGRSIGRRTYEAFGCRCEDCSALKRAYQAARYAVNPPARTPSIVGTAASARLREAVEVAVARGMSPSRIMERLAISYEVYMDVYERMAA